MIWDLRWDLYIALTCTVFTFSKLGEIQNKCPHLTFLLSRYVFHIDSKKLTTEAAITLFSIYSIWHYFIITSKNSVMLIFINRSKCTYRIWLLQYNRHIKFILMKGGQTRFADVSIGSYEFCSYVFSNSESLKYCV